MSLLPPPLRLSTGGAFGARLWVGSAAVSDLLLEPPIELCRGHGGWSGSRIFGVASPVPTAAEDSPTTVCQTADAFVSVLREVLAKLEGAGNKAEGERREWSPSHSVVEGAKEPLSHAVDRGAQRKLRQQQKKLKEEEAKLRPGKSFI
ncbi:uncharacterized protein LOC120698739 [Panicum virgatum]|uniref:uncharacterized protein LOC120698739 n=1 Tax=Panicum virgatum TaxID=38727 RepID=UPI0019D503FD|nr:uncharacterized protein LOC120698739 [Panicum virgatum]